MTPLPESRMAFVFVLSHSQIIASTKTPPISGPEFNATTILLNRDQIGFAISARLGRAASYLLTSGCESAPLRQRGWREP